MMSCQWRWAASLGVPGTHVRDMSMYRPLARWRGKQSICTGRSRSIGPKPRSWPAGCTEPAWMRISSLSAPLASSAVVIRSRMPSQVSPSSSSRSIAAASSSAVWAADAARRMPSSSHSRLARRRAANASASAVTATPASRSTSATRIGKSHGTRTSARPSTARRAISANTSGIGCSGRRRENPSSSAERMSSIAPAARIGSRSSGEAHTVASSPRRSQITGSGTSAAISCRTSGELLVPPTSSMASVMAVHRSAGAASVRAWTSSCGTRSPSSPARARASDSRWRGSSRGRGRRWWPGRGRSPRWRASTA